MNKQKTEQIDVLNIIRINIDDKSLLDDIKVV